MRFDDLTSEAQVVAIDATESYVTDDIERVQMQEWEISEALSPSGLRSYARDCLDFNTDGTIAYTVPMISDTNCVDEIAGFFQEYNAGALGSTVLLIYIEQLLSRAGRDTSFDRE